MAIIQLKRSTTTGNTPSSLAAGELALNLTDRICFYNDNNGVLRLFNMTSDAEKVSSGAIANAINAKANTASPSFTGNPQAPTPSANDNSTAIATTAFVKTIFAAVSGATVSPPVGQCRLVLTSTTVVTLKPYQGNKVWLNGAFVTIPAAGLTLNNTGLTASAYYYVYLWNNGGTLTLEASGTGHAQDATYGHEIKTGDGTRTLVGVVIPNASGNFVDTPAWCSFSNWYNRTENGGVNGTYNSSTSSGSTTELTTSARSYRWVWAGDTFTIFAEGFLYFNTNYTGNTGYLAVQDDQGNQPQTATTVDAGYAYNTGSKIPFHNEFKIKQTADGFRYGTLTGRYSPAGNASIYAYYTMAVSALG